MYQPRAFQETRREAVDRLVGAYPLATLVVSGADGLSVNHVPLLKSGDRLLGHVARGNELGKMDGATVLAVFQGPQAYVSPAWYPEKADDGRVVPTWNYVAAHFHGRLVLHDEAAWVLPVLARQTDAEESHQAQPWALQDAPADFVQQLAGGVIGVEIVIDRVEAKSKLSQNKPMAVRERVVAGLELRARGADHQLAEWMRVDLAGTDQATSG
ncbi:FMN-binding negative transcriptional regulator [Frateuria aurantia]